MNFMKEVLSISTGWSFLSKNRIMKLKKLDLRRLDGGCLVYSIRPMSGLKLKDEYLNFLHTVLTMPGNSNSNFYVTQDYLAHLSHDSSVSLAPTSPPAATLFALNAAAAAAAGNSLGILSKTPAVGEGN
jgi:hypothetical protein